MMSTLKMMLLILLLLLPLATFDSDGQAIPGDGVPSPMSSRIRRLLGGDKKSGRSPRSCPSNKYCGGGLCCRSAECTCAIVWSRPWSKVVCVCG
uniref:Conotoxin n=1 Tax=Conus betulinus TaxID=89764 RepID=A0A142C1I0_CONBE|nr:conotoxin [Conus betulinus]